MLLTKPDCRRGDLLTERWGGHHEGASDEQTGNRE
jgi:hypothetical protein